jgi:hypothetical protein
MKDITVNISREKAAVLHGSLGYVLPGTSINNISLEILLLGISIIIVVLGIIISILS